jgi:catechol 2,3-dioxygenase
VPRDGHYRRPRPAVTEPELAAPRSITAIGHVALRVKDLDRAIEHATEIIGLRVVERDDPVAYLSCDTTHHGLQLIASDTVGLDHCGFQAAGPEGLARVREVIAREAYTVIGSGPQEAGVTDAIRFVTPGGLVFEVFDGMTVVSDEYATAGIRPAKLQHLTFRTDAMEECERMFAAFGFLLSDRKGATTTFMRCNPDHHGIGLIRGGSGLHHYAWEAQTPYDLMRLSDLLHDHGKTTLFGPGRHGPGLNIFHYHHDADGVTVEYAADIVKVYDDATYQPLVWPDEAPFNEWGPPPTPEWMASCTPSAYLPVDGVSVAEGTRAGA